MLELLILAVVTLLVGLLAQNSKLAEAEKDYRQLHRQYEEMQKQLHNVQRAHKHLIATAKLPSPRPPPEAKICSM